MGIAQTSMFRGAFPKVSIDYSTHCIMELLQVRSTRAREFRGDYWEGSLRFVILTAQSLAGGLQRADANLNIDRLCIKKRRCD